MMIKRYYAMLATDGRLMIRDPMIGFALFGPLLLWAVIRYGVPYGFVAAEAFTHKDFRIYADFVLCFALLLIPLLMGMISGLVLLDERDEKLIEWYAVSPLTKRGYFIYRLLIPTGLSVIYGVWIIISSGLAAPPGYAAFSVIIMLALEAPLMALLLAAIASNKLEGLALTKGIGLFIFAPVIEYFTPWPWSGAAFILPTYWPAAVFQAGVRGEMGMVILFSVIGISYHLAAVLFLFRRFSSKTD
jgi:fluoroquinolone transport system permease protein